MDRITIYHMIEKILYAIYTKTFSEEKLSQIIEKETKKRENKSLPYEKAAFFSNLLENYKWYEILVLLKRFYFLTSTIKDQNLRKISILTSSVMKEEEFFLKERIKTVISINISECILFYYSSYEAIDYQKFKTIMQKSNNLIKNTTKLVEPEENYQVTLFHIEEEKKREENLIDKISKANLQQKDKILSSTKQTMKRFLNNENIDTFIDAILKTSEEIAKDQHDEDKTIYSFILDLMQDLYKRTISAWEKGNNAPLLELINQKK